MSIVTFKLNDFEGPLDLLLHLVAEKKMRMYDISISALIDQYLAFMGKLTASELNGATEFVEMAARLVYLKSVALLPRSDEREKLERELTGQLIEYSICKLAARRLGDMSLGVVFYVREPQKPVKNTDYEADLDKDDLRSAYLAVFKKSNSRRELSAEDITSVVAAPIVPVTTGILHILKGVRSGKMSSIREVFAPVNTTSEAVATFLGLLELIRAGRLLIGDDGGLTLITKEKTSVG